MKLNQPPSQADVKPSPGGALGPPKNKVVARAETAMMFTYSAKKNSANLSDEFSTFRK